MNELNNDVLADRARACHRVVRAMHDGNCPSCGHLGPSDQFYHRGNHLPCQTCYHPEMPAERHLVAFHKCPNCGFKITEPEAKAAMEQFRPFMVRNLEQFEAFRADFHAGRIVSQPPG